MDHIDRGADLVRGDFAFEAPAEAHAQLGFEAGMNQLGRAEHVTGRPGFQDAGEQRLVKTELLLDSLRGQADLPADMTLAGGDPTVDQRQLDAVGFVDRKPVEIGTREKLAAHAGGPEVVDRGGEVDGHAAITCGRIGESASKRRPARKQNAGRNSRSATTLVSSLSRRMKRPRSSWSTDTSAA